MVIYTKNKKEPKPEQKNNTERKETERRGWNTGTTTNSRMFRLELVKPAFIFHFLPTLQTLNY